MDYKIQLECALPSLFVCTFITVFLIDKLMLTAYFMKRQQRVASAVLQSTTQATVGRQAAASHYHISSAMNSVGAFASYQKQSYATRALLRQISQSRSISQKIGRT